MFVALVFELLGSSGSCCSQEWPELVVQYQSQRVPERIVASSQVQMAWLYEVQWVRARLVVLAFVERRLLTGISVCKADHKETTLESADSMELCAAVVESGRVRGSKAVVEQLLAEFDARESVRHQQHKRRRDSLNE